MLVCDLFKSEPKQWGLRGDQYLWWELSREFKIQVNDISAKEFEKQLIAGYESMTGVSIFSDHKVFLPAYNRGGMSSGYVHTSTWRNELIPYLLLLLKYAKDEEMKYKLL